MSTRLSVVIPVRDGGRYLGDALRSAVSQQPFEILVVDDGSRDDSVAVASNFAEPVRVISAVGRGAAAARNSGVAAASGELLAFLDADDRWTEGALCHLVRALSSCADTAIAHGRVREFLSPDLAPEVAARLKPRPGTSDALLPGSFLIRMSTFERVGPLDTELHSGEVIDWLSRLRSLGLREAPTSEVVLERRLHFGHLSPDKLEARGDLVRVVRGAIARRRASENSP